MHKTTISRKAIYIPHSIDAIALDELASRLAATIHDPGGTDAEWSHHSGLTKVLIADFVRAGGAGQLVIRHPVAHVPVQPDTQGAAVLVDDAACYLAESGSRFRITRYAEALPFVGLHPDELVPLDDVPMLVANAMCDPETDSEWHGFKRLVIEKRIYEAANCGALAMLDQMTRQRLSIRATGACSTAGDLCDFFSGGAEKGPPALSPEPVKLPAPVTWQGHTYQPGPEITPEEADEAAAWADVVNEAEGLGQVKRQDWTVTKYERDTAYRPALRRYLVNEWKKGTVRCPTPKEVLAAFEASQPPEVAKVLVDGFDYYDRNGNTKFASLDAIRKAIGRMTTGR